MNAALKASTYHDVMRHEFIDRQGCEPELRGVNVPEGTNPIAGRLEAQHDWVLLIFARSQRLRDAAARRAAELEGSHAYYADRGDQDAAITHLHYSVCRALAGLDYDVRAVGYLTFESAFAAIA